MSDKITVRGRNLDRFWEYRCSACGQLRLYPEVESPTQCGNCDSSRITIGRPGTLPVEPSEEGS